MSFFIVAVALERNVLAVTILELLKGAKYPHSNSGFMNIVNKEDLILNSENRRKH